MLKPRHPRDQTKVLRTVLYDSQAPTPLPRAHPQPRGYSRLHRQVPKVELTSKTILLPVVSRQNLLLGCHRDVREPFWTFGFLPLKRLYDVTWPHPPGFTDRGGHTAPVGQCGEKLKSLFGNLFAFPSFCRSTTLC